MSENGEIYTTGKNFTLLLAVTAVTNSTSVSTVEPTLIYKPDFLIRSGVPASGPAQSVKNLRSVDGGAHLWFKYEL